MHTQKTYCAPNIHCRTGAVVDDRLFRAEFAGEYLRWGIKPIDAPLVLPLGGVRVLCESAQFVNAVDFVSARAS